MNITTKLKFISAISTMTLLAFILVSIFSYENFKNAKSNYALISSLQEIHSKNIELMDQYFVYRESRDYEEWLINEIKSQLILNRVSKMIEVKKRNSTFVKLNLAKNKYSNLFRRIVDNDKRLINKSSTNMIIYNELDKRLLSQIKLKNHDFESNLDQIKSEFEDIAESTYKNLVIVLTILIVTLSVLVFFISIQLNRLIASRLNKILSGALIISNGQLDFKIEEKGDDEFASLANSINKMTAKLIIMNSELEIERVKTAHTLKLASLGEFSAGIAHEINNPLMIIQGNAQMIKTKIANGDSTNEMTINALSKIDQTCNRIDKIIKGLRSLSRNAESDPFSESSSKKIVDDALSLWEEKFKFNEIHFTKNYNNTNDILFDCSSTQISQVLMNIIANAYDVAIQSKEKWITVEIKLSDDLKNIEFSVMNSGPIMSDETKSKIMQPFFTTKEIGKGTGLGLSISRSIIEKHKGKFYLDNNSKNTRFVFELPLKQNVVDLVKAA